MSCLTAFDSPFVPFVRCQSTLSHLLLYFFSSLFVQDLAIGTGLAAAGHERKTRIIKLTGDKKEHGRCGRSQARRCMATSLLPHYERLR